MEMRKNPTADSANEAIAERREALADGANFCVARCDNIARRIYQIRQVAYLTDCDDPLEGLTLALVDAAYFEAHDAAREADEIAREVRALTPRSHKPRPRDAARTAELYDAAGRAIEAADDLVEWANEYGHEIRRNPA